MGMWDVLVRFEKFPTPDDLECYAYVSFISPEGPTQFLRPKSRFELAEGKKIVALGVIET